MQAAALTYLQRSGSVRGSCSARSYTVAPRRRRHCQPCSSHIMPTQLKETQATTKIKGFEETQAIILTHPLQDSSCSRE